MAELGKTHGKTFDEIAFDNFFARFNLEDMKEPFIENGFRTCRSLMIVTDNELKEIGFSSLGLRKELLGAVEEWKKPLMQVLSAGQQNKQPKTPTSAQSPSEPTQQQGDIKASPEYTQAPQSYTPQQAQFASPGSVKRDSLTGTPGLSPGIRALAAVSDKFHRIKRNETCPYPECTWAGLSTHFHCLVCSTFHTNKTERIRRHIQRHEVGESAHELDEYQRVKRENFFIFSAKECPEACKYSEEGVRHLHCKHCEWRTKKIVQMRRHLKAHESPKDEPDSDRKLEEYYLVKETQYVIYNKHCPEMCKYAQQGIRHIHCKHCNWRTQKFDSRLLAHFKSHHERHLLQYQAAHGIETVATTAAGIRTVSPLPTMAVQEGSGEQRANQDAASLPKPPKLMKMEMGEGEAAAIAVHLQQQGGFLNRPNLGTEDESADATAMLETELASTGKFKCMVCGDRQGLRTALFREQKGRNGPVDWNKTKQLFAYHHIKTTQPANQFICQKHMDEFIYFSRAYLSLWSCTTMAHAQPVHHQQQQQQHAIVTGSHEVATATEVTQNALVQAMPAVSTVPVYMMLNEHLNEQFHKQANQEVDEGEEDQGVEQE
eukprot:gene14042-15501_t